MEVWQLQTPQPVDAALTSEASQIIPLLGKNNNLQPFYLNLPPESPQIHPSILPPSNSRNATILIQRKANDHPAHMRTLNPTLIVPAEANFCALVCGYSGASRARYVVLFASSAGGVREEEFCG